MIIVEGMDNSGKSTLCNQLSYSFKLPVIHSPGPVDNPFPWVIEQLSRENPIIYDRFPLISEKVYGPILRNKDLFGGTEGAQLIYQLWKKYPLIIYCRPPTDEILSFKDGRAQMEGVIEKARLLLIAYDKFMISLIKEGRWNIVIHNFKDPSSLDYIKSEVKHYLYRKEVNPREYKRF